MSDEETVVELVKPSPDPPAEPSPSPSSPEAAAPPAFAPPAPGAELAAIAAALEGIRAELARLNAQVGSLVEPGVVLNHYRKGAALRIDDSQTRVNNPTF